MDNTLEDSSGRRRNLSILLFPSHQRPAWTFILRGNSSRERLGTDLAKWGQEHVISLLGFSVCDPSPSQKGQRSGEGKEVFGLDEKVHQK